VKRGNTALTRVVSVASVAAMAIAGAVLAAPAASAAPGDTGELVRTQPTANAVWIDSDGTLRSSANPSSNTYVANTTGNVAITTPGSFQAVSNIQIAVDGSAAGAATTVALPAGYTFANNPSVTITPKPVDLADAASLAGWAGTNASVLPAATVTGTAAAAVANPTLAAPAVGAVSFTFTPATTDISADYTTAGEVPGYLITVSNIRVVIPTTSALATAGGALPLTVTTGALSGTTTVAYVAPYSVQGAASADRAFDGTVTLPDLTVTELVPDEFSATPYVFTVTSDKVPTSGSISVSAAGSLSFSNSDTTVLDGAAAAATNTSSVTLTPTGLTNVKESFTLSGVKVANVPAGANLTVSVTPGVGNLDATAATFANTPNWTAPSLTIASSQTLPRIAGPNRYATAWQVAKAFVGTGSTANIILANGTNAKDGADALAANFLAGSLSAPIVLTQADTLPTETQYALLDATKGAGAKVTVYVMGKTDSVSQAVRDKVVALLKAAGHSNTTIKEVAGDNRYATSAAVVKQVGPAGIAAQPVKSGAAYLPTAFLASGTTNADALAAGGVSYAAKVPVLLTGKDALSDDVKAAIKDNGITQVIILGGTDRVSDAVKDSLADLGVTSVERFSGSDRYETAQIIAEWNWSVVGNKGTESLLANGTTGWPDALSAGPLAGLNTSPLLTVQKDSLGDSATKFLKDHKADLTNGVEALGSAAGSVADSVITAAQDALK